VPPAGIKLGTGLRRCDEGLRIVTMTTRRTQIFIITPQLITPQGKARQTTAINPV